MFIRRFALPLLAKAAETKEILGRDVVPNGREVLINLYTKTLQQIKAVPEREGYRNAVESFTRHRLKVCEEEHDCEVIERRLGCGQVEKLIEEARYELKLIGEMIDFYLGIKYSKEHFHFRFRSVFTFIGVGGMDYLYAPDANAPRA